MVTLVSMLNVDILTWINLAAFLILVIVTFMMVKVYRKPRRVVHFKPVVEGNKFQRRQSQHSQYIENITKQYSNNTNTDNIRISPINNVNKDFAFFIRNVLTPNECKQLIKAAELTGFEQRKYSGNGDDSASCCFQSKSLSNDIIFNRIKTFLPTKSYFDADSSLTMNELDYYASNNNQIIECYGDLKCLNTSCRVERYNCKEHLKIHRDGCVLVPNTKDIFTIYAVLIYLNDDYSGGNTRFCVDIDPNPKDGKYPYSFLDVKGNAGDALVFRHEILHKGGTVDKGKKYILRLDAAYQIIQ
eukprot:149333_1